MKKDPKRFVAWLLVLVLCLSVFPTAVTASEAGNTSVTFGGTKTFEGYPADAVAPTFRYVLTETTDGADYSDTAWTGGAGMYNFEPITYDREGDHTYTVREMPGNQAGVYYDNTEYTIAVKVEKNSQTGDLEAVTEISGDRKPLELDFANSYKARSVKTAFTAHKTLEGKALTKDAFTFELTTVEGDVLQRQKNDANGNVAFDEIEYSAAGTYRYNVKEVVPGTPESGMIYSSEVYTVTVKVTDDGSGQLSAQTSYAASDGTTASAMEFTNTYKAGTASVLFGGKKTLEGIASSSETFRFVLTEDGRTIQTASVKGAGAYEFKAITYDEEGEHYYTVYEIPGNAAGYVYSDRSYDIRVVVTANMAGNLTADVTGAKANGTGLDFTNICKIVKISKVDAASGKEVENAGFQIFDSGDILVEERTSGKEAHEIADLEIGETYTLKETAAPFCPLRQPY